MDSCYDDWEPPSDAQMKLMQARRERSDKISVIMGGYLLKGYKMLGITCPQCDTILMQTKQGVNYCIACSELDSDTDKDDPVTNQTAALTLAREREVRESPPRAMTSQPSSQPSVTLNGQVGSIVHGAPTERRTASAAHISAQGTVFSQPKEINTCASAAVSMGGGDSGRYVQDLLAKMDWATAELRGTQSVEYSIQLCQLVKSCADAVASVKTALDSR